MKYTAEYLKTLVDKREKLVKEARELHETLSSVEPGTDDASQAQTSYEKLREDLDKVDADFREAQVEIAKENELREMEARNRDFRQGIDRLLGQNPEEGEEVDPDAPVGTRTGSLDPAEDQAFREAYWASIRDRAVRMARSNGVTDIRNPAPMTAEHRSVLERVEKRALSSAVASGVGGGNTIPETFSNELIEFMKFYGAMVPGGGLCAEFSTPTGQDYHLMTVDDTANDGNLITEAKRVKGAANTDKYQAGNDPSFKRVTFQAHLYDSKIVPVSFEMLMDTQLSDLESILAELLGKRLGRKINADFTAELITAVKGNKVTTAAAASFTSDELMSLPHKIDPSYRGVGNGGGNNRLSVTFTDATWQILRLMKVPTEGTSGSGFTATPYLISSSQDLLSGEPDRLLGTYPIWLNQSMEAVATGKTPIVMGDFSEARIRTVQAPFMKVSEEFYWDQHMLAMIGLQRCDFKVTNASTFAALVQK